MKRWCLAITISALCIVSFVTYGSEGTAIPFSKLAPPTIDSQIEKSASFVVAVGIATMVAALFTVYAYFQVRRNSDTSLHRANWLQILLGSAGAWLFVFSAISFYEEPLAPKGFEDFYANLHGLNYCRSSWNDEPASWRVMYQTPRYTITGVVISTVADTIRIVYSGRCVDNSDCIPFSNPVMSIGKNDNTTLYRPFSFKRHTNGHGVVGYINFPNVEGNCGSLHLWEDASNAKDEKGNLLYKNEALSLTRDPNIESGPAVWAWVFIFGVVLFLYSVGQLLL